MRALLFILCWICSSAACACDLELTQGMGRADLQKKLECLKKLAEAGTTVPIATIIASHLTPAQIKANYGEAWVLADGRKADVSSAYFKVTGKDVLPDLRGVFLRGMNEGRADGKQDPGSDRNVGSFQAHMLGAHNHALPFKRHGLANGKGAGNLQIGEPPVSTLNAGGAETRPNNVAVYFYIKIN